MLERARFKNASSMATSQTHSNTYLTTTWMFPQMMGDLCLLAGSPRDAADHYTTAIQVCKSVGDVLWHAGDDAVMT